MYLLRIVIIVVSFYQVSPNETDEKLAKYKSEINKIGFDVENFVFDLAKEVFRNANKFFNVDYDTDYENAEEKPLPRSNSIKKESHSYHKKPVKHVVEDARRKRDTIDYDYMSERSNSLEDLDCPSRKEEKLLEDKHMEDIKEELRRLFELVALLKDQQTVISMLDRETKNLNDQQNPKNLLKVLENINNDLTEEKEETKNLPTHKELEVLKFDVRKAISALNHTKVVLTEEKRKELTLENELIHQKQEIDLLKTLVNKLMTNNSNIQQIENQKKIANNTKLPVTNVREDGEIVGDPMFIPKSLPVHKIDISTKQNHEKDQNYRTTSKIEEHLPKLAEKGTKGPNKMNERSDTILKNHTEKTRVRSSDSEDISQLFDDLTKPKKTDLEAKISELEDKLEKQSQQQSMRNELLVLRKLMEHQKSNPKPIKNDDVELLKKLQVMINLMNTADKPQGKSDDVEEELEKLEQAINKLRPNEGNNPVDIPFSDRGQPVSKGQSVQLSTKQITELRKKIDQIINMQVKKDNNYPIGDYSQNQDLKRAPFQYPSWYRGPPESMPPRFDYSYYPNMFNPFYSPYPLAPQGQFNGQYGSDYGPGPTAYTQSSVLPETDVKNQFFQATQFDRPFEEVNYNPEASAGYFPQQSDMYSPNGNYNGSPKINSVNELKTEIDALEKIIADMNTPSYNEAYNDKATLYQLEKEIKGLKAIIMGLNQDKNLVPQPSYSQDSPTQNSNYEQNQNQNSIQSRYKRSTDNTVDDSLTTTDSKSSDVQLFDDVTSKLREYLVEEDKNARTADYNGIIERINRIKSQLGQSSETRENGYYKPFQLPQFSNFKQSSDDLFNKDLLNFQKGAKIGSLSITPKGDDIFSNVILKIVDKVIHILPKILGKIFGTGIETLVDNIHNDDQYYGNGYGNQNDVSYYGSSNNLESVFYNLGLFGYVPIILLRLVNAVSTFVNTLRKNKFFKNFLVPASVLLVVAGAIVFLIWWLNEDEESMTKQIGSDGHYPYSNYKYDSYRSAYTGTNIDSNPNNYYLHYPTNYYNNPYYYYNNYPKTSRHLDSRKVNAPGLYYRTYFDNDGSKKRLEY